MLGETWVHSLRIQASGPCHHPREFATPEREGGGHRLWLGGTLVGSMPRPAGVGQSGSACFVLMTGQVLGPNQTQALK